MRSIETSETYVDYLEGKVMENLSQRMIDKSIEAFMMGLEIYNKPTITYRIEGFSFPRRGC